MTRHKQTKVETIRLTLVVREYKQMRTTRADHPELSQLNHDVTDRESPTSWHSLLAFAAPTRFRMRATHVLEPRRPGVSGGCFAAFPSSGAPPSTRHLATLPARRLALGAPRQLEEARGATRRQINGTTVCRPAAWRVPRESRLCCSAEWRHAAMHRARAAGDVMAMHCRGRGGRHCRRDGDSDCLMGAPDRRAAPPR